MRSRWVRRKSASFFEPGYCFFARSALLRAGLRRKESLFCSLYPALTPSARKRASGRAGLTSRRAYGAERWGRVLECPEQIGVIELSKVVKQIG
jgi:hypothetical protein